MVRLTRFLVLALMIATIVGAAPITIDFEGLPDSTVLGSQYPGFVFSNAITLTAGIGLNELEFPPHSGATVASDNGGPMTIAFTKPARSFGGYFTYTVPLTIDAFGDGKTLLTTVRSAFSSNEALSGAPTSSPNEFLQLTSSSGITSILIIGDPNGSSFALDDALVVFRSTGVAPEPATLAFVVIGIALLLIERKTSA